jgi:transcriptional regulator with XRE-family HTH domain
MPTAPDPGHEPPLQEVAHTIRRLRKARGLSMAALAELAGLSQPFISQLESGAHTPSLSTLYRVATALGVVPGALFGETAPLTGWVRHEPSRISATDTPHASVATLLVPGGRGGLLEAYEWEISSADDEDQWWQHEGEDLIYVISGAILVEVRDAEPSTVEAGGSAHLLETHRPHRWSLVGEEPARILLIVGTPPVGTATR